jgi:hypothetical protein
MEMLNVVRSVVKLAAVCAILEGCGMTQAKGWLGVKWGEDAAAAAARLGIACPKWEPWGGEQSYERCTDLNRRTMIYGVEGRLEVIRRGGSVEGIIAVFQSCTGHAKLLDGVVAEFKVERGSGEPYRSASSGEVVRLFRDPRDGTCEIVVTGAGFGKVYSEHLLRRGLGNLGGALQPH